MSRTVRGCHALIAAALLTACIPSTGDDLQAARAPGADPNARPGGRIVVGVAEPDGIDPSNVHEPAGRLIVGTFCDQLVALDPVTGAPSPSIASSWTIADRGMTLFLELRRDVRFHNGRALVAEDVVRTLSRLADQEYASEAAALVEPISGYGFVHGDAEPPDERFRRRLAGVTAVDPHTVQIKLGDARSDFLRTLADPATSPVPAEEIERDAAAFARQPLCAGPYRVSEPWLPGAPVKLERFAEYRAPVPSLTRGGAGYADEIEFVTFRSRAAEARAFARGDLDVAHVPEDSGARDVVRAPVARTEFVGLPTTRPPFDRPAVRLALSRALDREAIARDVFGGGRVPATSFLPPAIPGVHRAGACADAPASGDVAGARQLLARAGIDLSGRRVPVLYNDEYRNRLLAEAVARTWRDAFGMRAEPTAMPWETLLEAGRRPAGLAGPFRFGWEATSADGFLVPLFHPNGVGKDNLSRFGSRDFNDAIKVARRALDDGERIEAYRRAEDVVCAEMPMIPVVHPARALRFKGSLASAVGRTAHVVWAEPLVRELFVRAS